MHSLEERRSSGRDRSNRHHSNNNTQPEGIPTIAGADWDFRLPTQFPESPSMENTEGLRGEDAALDAREAGKATSAGGVAMGSKSSTTKKRLDHHGPDKGNALGRSPWACSNRDEAPQTTSNLSEIMEEQEKERRKERQQADATSGIEFELAQLEQEKEMVKLAVERSLQDFDGSVNFGANEESITSILKENERTETIIESPVKASRKARLSLANLLSESGQHAYKRTPKSLDWGNSSMPCLTLENERTETIIESPVKAQRKNRLSMTGHVSSPPLFASPSPTKANTTPRSDGFATPQKVADRLALLANERTEVIIDSPNVFVPPSSSGRKGVTRGRERTVSGESLSAAISDTSRLSRRSRSGRNAGRLSHSPTSRSADASPVCRSPIASSSPAKRAMSARRYRADDEGKISISKSLQKRHSLTMPNLAEDDSRGHDDDPTAILDSVRQKLTARELEQLQRAFDAARPHRKDESPRQKRSTASRRGERQHVPASHGDAHLTHTQTPMSPKISEGFDRPSPNRELSKSRSPGGSCDVTPRAPRRKLSKTKSPERPRQTPHEVPAFANIPDNDDHPYEVPAAAKMPSQEDTISHEAIPESARLHLTPKEIEDIQRALEEADQTKQPKTPEHPSQYPRQGEPTYHTTQQKPNNSLDVFLERNTKSPLSFEMASAPVLVPGAAAPIFDCHQTISEAEVAAIEKALREADMKQEEMSYQLALQIQAQDEEEWKQTARIPRQQGKVRVVTKAQLQAECGGRVGAFGRLSPPREHPLEATHHASVGGHALDDEYDGDEHEPRAGYRMNASAPQQWSRVDRNTIVGPNNQLRTKHDTTLQGQANAQRLGLDADNHGQYANVGNTAYNAFRNSMSSSRQKGVASHGTGRAGSDAEATRGGAMDTCVRDQIRRAINTGLISKCNGVVKEGKEAVVYHAEQGEDSSGFDVAIKVFKRIKEFRGRSAYVEGDPRYSRQSYSNANGREQLEIWAEKEYRNLVRADRAGVPVPSPLHVKENVLFMRFIGEQGWPTPQIRELDIREGSKKWRALYRQVIEAMRHLYQGARLVHGDLSEYNILVAPAYLVENKDRHVENDRTDLQAVLIDFGQAVDVRHPEAMNLLKRDIGRVRAFFILKGVKTMEVNVAMRFVTESDGRDQLDACES